MNRETETILAAFRAAGRPIPEHLFDQDSEQARIVADIISRRDRLRARADVLRARL